MKDRPREAQRRLTQKLVSYGRWWIGEGNDFKVINLEMQL